MGQDMGKNDARSIRENYDRLADEYAVHLFDELLYKPLDRDLLDRFASEVRVPGEVCDLGCGPGQVARYLHEAGTKVFGLDLSPQMVDNARQLTPDVRFVEGNMLALEIADQSIAGIASFYAIVNIPEPSLPQIFKEMARVLRPDGLLLLAFHIGDQVVEVTDLWGRQVTMDFFFFLPSTIGKYLKEAGFRIEDVIEREPYGPEVEHQSRRAYIFARKPDTG